MTIFATKSFSLRRPDNSTPFLRLPPDGLAFDAPGVYTLEGPNQSGKSTFLKALVGALPAPIHVQGSRAVSLSNGRPIQIKSPAHAASLGIVGIFQDDLLIASLSVSEQLVLRHGRLRARQFINYAWMGLYSFFAHPVEALLNMLPTPMLAEFVRRGKPARVDWLETSQVESAATDFLREIGQDPEDILPLLPVQLSGGKKGLAKIVAAEVHFRRGPAPRVLLLDEVFSGLQRDLWPPLLERYRRWAHRTGGIVVAVTHNPAEVDLWQPVRRLHIESGRLVTDMGPSGSLLQPGIPRPVSSFPMFRLPRSAPKETLTHLIAANISARVKITVIASPHCVMLPSFRDLISALHERSKGEPLVVSFPTSENAVDLCKLVPVLEEVIVHTRTDDGILVLVGGGSALNMGGFIASVVFRGVCRTLLIPTTLLAIADVAIGSKTSVPLVGGGDNVPAPLNLKHSIGTYHNPNWVITDPRFVDALSVEEATVGFSEIIKHGLLQDPVLLGQALSFIGQKLTSAKINGSLADVIGSAGVDDAIDLAEKTAALKAQVLALDPFEQAYGKILLYGHLHAHCIERVTLFKIPHGVAVYLGMLLETYLGGSRDLYEMLLPIVRDTCSGRLDPLAGIDDLTLHGVYLTQNKGIHITGARYVTLRVERAGEYAIERIVNASQEPGIPYEVDAGRAAAVFVAAREKPVTFRQILSAWRKVQKDLGLL